MTTFAAQTSTNGELWSPVVLQQGGDKNDPNTSQKIVSWTALDANGQNVDINWSKLSKGAAESLSTEEKVKEVFRNAGYVVPNNYDMIPLFTGSINFEDGVTENGKVVFTFQDVKTLGADWDNASNVVPGDIVYVMQETAKGSGVWDIYPAQVGENFQISVSLPHGGSIVVVKALSDGSVVTIDKKSNTVIDRIPADNVANNNAGKGTSTNASGATSPKTGEF